MHGGGKGVLASLCFFKEAAPHALLFFAVGFISQAAVLTLSITRGLLCEVSALYRSTCIKWMLLRKDFLVK